MKSIAEQTQLLCNCGMEPIVEWQVEAQHFVATSASRLEYRQIMPVHLANRARSETIT